MIVTAALICWLAGFILLWRFSPCNEESSLTDSSEAIHSEITERLCIIIPARNEELSLPRLLRTIREQAWQPAQVLVVDDDSTDQTADVARAGGATVISPGPLPEGWRGKTWACQRGAAATSAKHLLFLDADTWFEPDGLRRIMHTYLRQPGVLSVIPYHVVPTVGEQFSAFFNLVMASGIGAFTLPPRQPDGLCGQMLLIDRETYWSVGGHERVRGHVLENLHLATHLRASGVMLRCRSGRGSLCVRMYAGGLPELVKGWSKGFASGAGTTSALVMGLAIAWLSGAVMAASAAVEIHGVAAIIAYVLFCGQFHLMLRRAGSFRVLTALLYPIPLLFFFVVFAISLARSGRQVSWKGRAFRAA